MWSGHINKIAEFSGGELLCEIIVGVYMGVVYCDIYYQPVAFGTFQVLSIWSGHIDKIAEFSGGELLCEITVGVYMGVVYKLLHSRKSQRS